MASSSFLASGFGNALLLSSIAVPLLAALLLSRAMLQGLGRVVAAQIPYDVIRWAVTLVLIAILLVEGDGSPEAAIVAVLIGLAISLSVSVTLLNQFIARLPASEDEKNPNQSRWLSLAFPFLAIADFGIVGTELSTLLLGSLAGPREAGLYQPIAKSAPVMLLATYSIENVLAPRLVQKWEEGDLTGLQQLMRRSAFASFITTALITGAILLASPLIFLAFGREFAAYQSYFYWVGAAQIVNAMFGSSALLLAMVGDMASRLKGQVITLAIQASLAIILIPRLGAAGAVISLVTAIITWAILNWWLALRATGINTFAFSLGTGSQGERG